ncbi:MAG: hypothetical protein WC996_02245 [Peptostreptococcales bacterium]|nr:hypothetical protein [Candidatus ainarchaeum sp.]
MQENIFQSEDPIFYNLNQGEFKDNFYFGKVISVKSQQTNCVILSDRNFFVDYESVKVKEEINENGRVKKIKVPMGINEITENGLHYRNPIIDCSNFWSNEAINEFILNQDPRIDKTELFNQIKNQLIKYMDIHDSRIYDLITSYIIGTYCFSLFNSYGYLFLNCEKNSGKTKLTNLIGYMAFNSINATNPTESSLFRLCESNKPTFLIDDFERIEDDKQKYISQILKTGYKKGGQTLRTDTNNNNQVRLFDLYSPKVINNVGELDEITLSRCIVIRLLRTKTEKGRLEPKETNKIWKEIRDNCYLFIMQNWKEIKEIYTNYQTDLFNNRDLEISKGILSIAKFISQETHQNIESYLLDSFQDRDYIDYSTNKNYLLFKTMYDYVKDTKLHTTLEIETWIKMEYPDIFDKDKKMSYWIGKTLSKIPLFKNNKLRSSNSRQYLLSKEIIKDYMERQNYPFELSQMSETAPVYQINDDEVKELSEEIRDTCQICKQQTFVKYTSIKDIGKNYCDNCVNSDIRKQKSKELLDQMY